MSETPLRSTRQRRAVIGLLADTDEFRSAQEIHEAIRRGGDRVGLATVYRTLQSLVDGGEVDMVKTDAGESVYRRCSAVHHHHLVCRSCGAVEDVTVAPSLERQVQRSLVDVEDRTGFAAVSHRLDLIGTCRNCS